MRACVRACVRATSPASGRHFAEFVADDRFGAFGIRIWMFFYVEFDGLDADKACRMK